MSTVASPSPVRSGPAASLGRALRFYWLVIAAGAVLMAMEIVSSRVLSPHFGSSVYVWGSIISVFLGCLSVGYTLGGRLADRYPTLEALGKLVVLVGLCMGVLLLVGEGWAEWLGDLTQGSPAGTLLTTFLLFGPATVLIGMVAPWAVRLAARDLEHLGNTAGRLYALSTMGSLAGTLLSTFVLIPFLQIRQIFGLLLAVTVLTGLVALAGSLHRQRLTTALAGALLVLALAHLPRSESYRGAVYRRITPYQTLQVVDLEGKRFLQSEGVNQAAVDLGTGRPALSYPQISPAALLINPDIRRVLVLGMGAGNIGDALAAFTPEVEVHYVEIDPAVAEVAKRFMGFEEGPRSQVHIADGRRFLEASEERWDLIFCDTYIGLSVPFHLTTREFFALVKERLTPGGLVAVNLAGGLGYPFTRATFRSLAENFSVQYVFGAPYNTNVVVVGADGGVVMSDAELRQRAADLEPVEPVEVGLEKMIAHRQDLDFEPLDATLLTDDYAPVERLISIRAKAAPGRSGGDAP